MADGSIHRTPGRKTVIERVRMSAWSAHEGQDFYFVQPERQDLARKTRPLAKIGCPGAEAIVLARRENRTRRRLERGDRVNPQIHQNRPPTMSPDFLASDFIQNNELPPLLNAAKDDKAMILWMAVRPSMHEGTVIDKYQALNDPSKPLSTLTRPEQEKELKRIFQKLKEAIQSTSAAPVGIHDDAREDFPMSAPQQMPTHEQVQPPSEAASIGHGDEFRTKNQSPTKPRKISQRDRLPRSSHPALAESKLQTELPIETRSSQLDGTLPLPIASTIGRTDNEGAKSFDIEVRGYELVASFENSVLNVPLTVDRLTMDLLDLFE